MRVTTVILMAAALVAAPATAATADIQNNPNAFTLTLTCGSRQFTGTTAGSSALQLEGGGVAILAGLVDDQGETGEVIVPINKGLSRNGSLEECTYFSPRLQRILTASVLFVPR